MYLFVGFNVFDNPIDPLIHTFLSSAGEGERDQIGVENFNAFAEIIHFEGDIGQKVNFVDDEGIDAPIHARIFIGLVIAFGDGGNENTFMRAKHEIWGANKVTFSPMPTPRLAASPVPSRTL